MTPPEQPVILYKQDNGEPSNNNFKVEAAAGSSQKGRHWWSVISSTQVNLPGSDEFHTLLLDSASYEAQAPDPEIVKRIAEEAMTMTTRIKDAIAQDRFDTRVSTHLERSDELNDTPPRAPFLLEQRRLSIVDATLRNALVDLQPAVDEVRRRLLELEEKSNTGATAAASAATPEPQAAATG